VQSVVAKLAEPLSQWKVDAVCGPLVEGAFIRLMTALLLNVQFTYSERFARSVEGGLLPAGYRIPASLREGLRGKRVVIVNDVINAGSAMRGTFIDLQSCGAIVTGIGALLVLGTAAAAFASGKGVPLWSVATLPNTLWTPAECRFVLPEFPCRTLRHSPLPFRCKAHRRERAFLRGRLLIRSEYRPARARHRAATAAH
jgi:orotate phosphoribosyltransferase